MPSCRPRLRPSSCDSLPRTICRAQQVCSHLSSRSRASANYNLWAWDYFNFAMFQVRGLHEAWTKSSQTPCRGVMLILYRQIFYFKELCPLRFRTGSYKNRANTQLVPASPMLKTCDSEHASILHDSPDPVRVNTILSVYLHATLISTKLKIAEFRIANELTCHLQSCDEQPKCRLRHCPNNKSRCGGGRAICWTARRFWLSSTRRMDAWCFFNAVCSLLVHFDSKCKNIPHPPHQNRRRLL